MIRDLTILKASRQSRQGYVVPYADLPQGYGDRPDWTGYEEEFGEGTAVFDIKANTKVI